MNPDTLTSTITLDWDNISPAELQSRLTAIVNQEKYLKSVFWRESPMKGFHVKLTFNRPVPNAWLRRYYKDDSFRIIGDLLRTHVHDVLWTEKIIPKLGMTFRAGKWRKFESGSTIDSM